MPNEKLQGKTFKLPEKLNIHLEKIFKAYKGAKNVEGYQRLEELVGKDSVSYEQLKLMKNFFDNYNGKRKGTTYMLNGGTMMKAWIEKTLEHARQNVKGKKEAMKNVGMDNEFIDTHEKNNVRIDNHDSDTNKILRQEGIYNMRLLESLITTIDKNRELCLMDNRSHLY